MPMNNKKKKRTSAKKKGKSKKNLHLHKSADDLLSDGDAALHTQDTDHAIALYSAAIDKVQKIPTESQGATAGSSSLSNEQQHDTLSDPTGNSTTVSLSDLTLLVSAFEKRAHAHVSLSHQDEALNDYQAALNALTQLVESRQLMASDENNNTAGGSGEDMQIEGVSSQEKVTLEQDENNLPDLWEQKAALYLYIGQLKEGTEALEVYKQGIACLQEAMGLRERASAKLSQNGASSDPSFALHETRKQLAAAYCTISELYLTDLCFEEHAERECDSFVSLALRLTHEDYNDGEPIVDALQAATNLGLSQKRGLEAVDFILRAYRQMQKGCEALASLVGVREASDPEQAIELMEHESVQQLPGFEFRCQTAKLLLECAAILKEQPAGNDEDPRRSQCLQAAIDVLGSLLAENDEVVEIWYLTGEAFAAMNTESMVEAAHYWTRAKTMLEAVQQSLEQEVMEATEEAEEEDLQRHLDEVTCQLEEVVSKLESCGATNDDIGE